MTDIWNARREQLEQAFVQAALDLAQHTGAESFTVPIKGTTPLLVASVGGIRGDFAELRADALYPGYKVPAKEGL